MSSEDNNNDDKQPLVDNSQKGIGKYINGLTPEQKAAHYQMLRDKIQERAQLRRSQKQEAKERAQKLLPELIAHQISESIQGQEFNPTIEVIEKLRALLSTGIPIQEMKSKYFKSLSQNTWEKMTRFIFKDEVAHAEDIGLNLSAARKNYLRTLKKRIKTLRKEIKTAKKNGKPYQSYYTQLAQAEDRLFTLEMEFGESLHDLGIVGEKNKAASINIHMSVPRPKPVESSTFVEAESVKPTALSLDDLI